MPETIIYHLPERKVESAFAQYLKSAMDGLGVTISTRFANAEVVLPALCIYAGEAEPMDVNVAGNWSVNLTLEIRSSRLDYTVLQHDNIVGTITDLLLIDSLPTELNSQGVANFTVIQTTLGKRKNQVDEDSMITEQVINIDCIMQ